MAARSEIPINLEEFGLSGIAIVASLRKQAMMKNALGNCARIEVEGGQKVIKETRLGDSEIVEVLGFVAKAPFPTDLNGFYDFCDRMDERDFGSAARLFDALSAAKARIQEGLESPLEGSPDAVTQNSA